MTAPDATDWGTPTRSRRRGNLAFVQADGPRVITQGSSYLAGELPEFRRVSGQSSGT